jgi:hypothetical protein
MHALKSGDAILELRGSIEQNRQLLFRRYLTIRQLKSFD